MQSVTRCSVPPKKGFGFGLWVAPTPVLPHVVQLRGTLAPNTCSLAPGYRDSSATELLQRQEDWRIRGQPWLQSNTYLEEENRLAAALPGSDGAWSLVFLLKPQGLLLVWGPHLEYSCSKGPACHLLTPYLRFGCCVYLLGAGSRLAQVSLDLIVWLRMALNSRCSCLGL